MRNALPELPHQKRQRFIEQYGLSTYDAGVLVSSRALAQYFETVVTASKTQPKLVTNWIMGELSAALNKANLEITESPVSTAQLAKLLQRIEDNTISGKIAKTIFETLWNGEGDDVDSIIDKQGLKQVTDSGAIETLIDKIIADNPDNVAEYRAGKEKLFGFFVGLADEGFGRQGSTRSN